ncbi:MAG: putative beta-lactamase class [Moraxellaceae bacterium]|jgi:CubicO group peptidase (beta-lactamase class C family)|nr:putative beta-lactamase class [Moraxellaceae bacterium]
MSPFSFLARHRRTVALLLLAILAVAAVGLYPVLKRAYTAETLFDEGRIVHNFTHMTETFPAVRVLPAPTPRDLPAGAPLALPGQFSAFDKMFTPAQYLQDTGTDGLIVLQDGRVVFEQYYQGNSADNVHVSWSLAKSTISAMLGIAQQEGRIKSVMDPVERYAPQLKGTAYEGVPLRDVLQMSSGVAFDENYDNPQADVVQLARTLVLGGSFNAYAQKLKRAHPPGTVRHYSSFDTQVLAMVLEGATGRRVADYMQEKLWQPMGAENEAWWLADSEGMVMGFGGFNAVLRDYARFGQLYLDKGRIDGKEVVPASWIAESLAMAAPHLLPQAGQQNELGIGYGYQWWIPEDAARDFMGIGVYNQFIYVSPSTRTVIVKTSGNHRYTSDDFVPIMQHLALFRAIAAAASGAAR